MLHLPSYADRYTDIPRLIRLKFIAQVCPELSVLALELALNHVKTTYNVKLYDELYKTLCVEVDRKYPNQSKGNEELHTTGGSEPSTSSGRGELWFPMIPTGWRTTLWRPL